MSTIEYFLDGLSMLDFDAPQPPIEVSSVSIDKDGKASIRLSVAAHAPEETRNYARAVAAGVYGIEPLPGHLGYAISGDLEDPRTKIYALVDSWDKPVLLFGERLDEARRWILGGLALGRVIRDVEERRARVHALLLAGLTELDPESLFSMMQVPASALFGEVDPRSPKL